MCLASRCVKVGKFEYSDQLEFSAPKSLRNADQRTVGLKQEKAL